MADTKGDLYQCVASWRISCEVDPIEHAAEHPLIQRIVRFDFDNCDEAISMADMVAKEFYLSGQQIIAAICKSAEILHGSSNGQA